MKGALLGALALALGAAFLGLDREQSVSREALVRAALAGGASVAWALAALGAGAAWVRWRSPALLEDGRGWLHAAVAGLALWGLGGGLLAALGALRPLGLVLLAAALAAGWWLRPRLPRVRLDGAGAAVLALGVLPGLFVALAPPVDTDELYYHLSLPRELLAAGGFVGGMFRPDGSRPLALHLPYAAVMAAGGDAAPRLLHLLVHGGCLGAVLALGRAWLPRGAGLAAAALLLGSWTFSAEAGLASNNVPVALCVLAALDAALRGEAVALALAAGAGLAIKYTAAGPLAGVFLVAALPWRRRVVAGLGALLLVAPWWLRNLVDGLHPLFPFAGWPTLGAADFVFQYPEKYGAGRDPLDQLLLPWNAVMTAQTGTFRFLGRLNPAFLLGIPAAIWAARRPGMGRSIAVAAALGGLCWAVGPHWLRYLLPALPLLALASGLAVAEGGLFSAPLARVGVVACWLAGLGANAGPLLLRAADRWPAAAGQEIRADFLARSLDEWPALAWANAHLPKDARVALLFFWDSALLERRTLLGSVEDHIPTRYFLLQHGDRSLRALQEAGADYAIVGRVHFLRKLYPFLDDDAFAQQFAAPEAGLDALLLREATLVFQQGRTRVYRLAPP